jgi:serine/threonine-protein kinase
LGWIGGKLWLVLRIAMGLALGAGLFDRVVMPWVVRHEIDSVVPSVAGRPREEAEEQLRAADLEIGSVQEVPHRSVVAGHVVAQEPPGGSRVREHRAVHLLISQGAPARQVPPLAGKTLRHARLELSQRGLLAGEVTVLQGSTRPEGEVVATRPAHGEMPDRSGRVDLLVSGRTRQELYLMPDVRRWEKEEAASLLRRLGVRVSVLDRFGWVGFQDPAPGEPVWSGSMVTLE